MVSKGLTNIQLKNLEDFLRKCDYNKEELAIALQLPIEKEENLLQNWIRDPKVQIKHVIEYFFKENDLEWLISKLAVDLYNKYEKTISQGQAEAVLKRVLDIKLSSSGRTQLYELRKKIRRYEKFLTYFRNWAEIYDFTFKVVILGLSSKQASTLLLIPPSPGGEGQRETLGVGFYSKVLEIYDNRVKLQLWDISSGIKWRYIRQTYCKGAHGAIIVYDKSDRDSFESAKELYHQLKEGTNLKFRLKERSRIYVDMPIIIIGLSNGNNVNAGEGQSLAKDWGASGYIELQGTDSQNFENVLVSLSLGIITNYQNGLKRSPIEDKNNLL